MQLDIKVLGPGCAKCEYLEQRARLAIEEVKAEVPELQASIEKLTDMADFMAYGLMMTPGLVINGKLVSEGRVASQRTIAEWLRAALNGGQ
ncbi:MAG: thioredoxin family protein [Anaerolineae bacterium]